MDKKHVVYSLSVEDRVFYVGRTSIGLENRVKQHLSANRKIVEHLNGRECQYSILETCHSSEIATREKFWINYFGHQLLNCKHGSYPKLERREGDLMRTSIDEPLATYVLEMANKEKRSFSNMVNVLLDEALKNRRSRNKTPIY